MSTNARWKSTKSFNHGTGSGCPDAFESIDVTPMVSAWSGEQIGEGLGRQSIELRATNEDNDDFQKRFCSRNPSSSPSLSYCGSSEYIPTLSITYNPELGRQSWYSMTGHPLNDRSSLMVNNKNGNAVVMASDANVAGLGMDMTIDRFYNSQLPDAPATTLGQGWTLGIGPDVRLEKKSQWRYDYHAPSGTVFGSFMRHSSVVDSDNYFVFERPTGGVNAELKQDGDTFSLEFHGNDMTYEFTELGPDGHAYLTKMIDRSDNEIALTYSGLTSDGIPKLSTIVDTGGRTYNATYSGDHITQISHNTAGVSRTWAYAQSGGTLGSYTDPAGKTVIYDYTTLPSGSQVLTTITDPTTAASAPTTYLEYGHEDERGVDQVTVVRYRYGGGNDDTYDFAFTYYTNRAPVCADEDSGVGDFSTVVTDPNAGETTYCYEGRNDSGDDAQTWVFDAEDNERSTTFSADNATLRATTPGNSATNNATVAEYGQIADQLRQVTAPKNEGDGDQAATASFDYDHSGGNSASPAGGDYLPSSVTDANSSCSRFEYDDNGRTTAAYTGLTPADPRAGSNRNCSSEGGDTSFHREYNDDGTTKESWDGNAENESGQDDPAQSDKTIYTYWAKGDSGYVAGSKGQVKTIRKPGGSCETNSRELCTSYTYDGAGRVATMTDGRGKVTRYTYDAIDRTTQVLHDGATACAHSAGTCITYAYDAEGNMTTRTEQAGVTTFEYDRLNRQIGQDTPDGVMMDLQYDGVGNLTRYEQSFPGNSWDEVVYDYDAANRLVSVTDASGTITVSPDSDGRVEKIEFPGAGGVTVDYSYQSSGKPETLVVTNGADDELRRHEYDYTKEIDLADYGLSGTLQTESDQMQTRTTDHVAADVDGTITYDYDDTGRLTSAGDSNNDQRDYEYSYDEVNNITEADIDGDITYYGYDLAGQLCWSGDTNGTHLDTTCPATPTGNTTYQHDAAGNNLNTTANPTVYDAASRVSQIGGINAEYYDRGNDIRHRHGNTYAANGTLGITALKNGTNTRLLTRDPAGTILNHRDSNGTTNFITEPTGNVVALIDPDAHEVGAYTYGPYGDTHTHAQNGGTRAETNPFRYIGAYLDIEGDNHYKLGARYYDGAGHFTQPDAIAGTIQNPKTMTAYNYAGGDPINFADPTGNFSMKSLDAVGLAGDLFQIGYALYEGDTDEAWSQTFGFLVGSTTGAACTASTLIVGAGPCYVVGSTAGYVATALARNYYAST